MSLRHPLILALLLAAACSGGDDGSSSDLTGDDDDDVTGLTPWSEVVTTQEDQCCRTVQPQFEWSPVVDHEGLPATWVMPDDPVGALVVFHGTNGIIETVQQVEYIELYNLLVPRGIGIVLTVSEDRDAKQWDTAPLPDNVDFPRVQSLLGRIADETAFTPDLPLVGLGFSQGCSMVDLLADQGPDAGVNAVGMVFHNCGQGGPRDQPALFVDAENDGASSRMASLASDHPDGTLLSGTEVPLHPNRFAKLISFSPEDSVGIFDELVGLEVVDTDGLRTVDFGSDPEAVMEGIENALRVRYAADVVQQLRVVWALHRISAQNKLDEAAWIEAQIRGSR